ncbi:MAG: group 1 glycosyl transferase [Flavobacteriales bacterium]|nr:group 1 glycosyl transferase [Flavobacteriales bacterium]
MKKVIISVTNDLTTDQRVDKVARSLIGAGFSVLLLGVHSKPSIGLSDRPYAFHRFNMIFKKGFFFYFEFNVRLFLFLITNHSSIYLSNDLDTLCANFLASKLKNVRLIYDSHELFSELPELLNRPFVKSVWIYIEKQLLKRIKYSYTVSESIASYYYDKYGVNMSVISNFPNFRLSQDPLISQKHKIIIYQGAINKDRGIKLMIDAMKYIDAKLYIVGGGYLLEDMIHYTQKNKLIDKIVFFGKLPFSDLFQITKKANLGLSFEEDTCLAYRYSLPNKIFDYIHAEIPILVSDLPEFKKVIHSHPVGEILQSRDIKSVANQINQMLSYEKSKWYPYLIAAKKDLCWENQETKLLSLFY